MYGEKAEEAQELRLDLDDVKTMYRSQVRIHSYTHTKTKMVIKCYHLVLI